MSPRLCSWNATRDNISWCSTPTGQTSIATKPFGAHTLAFGALAHQVVCMLFPLSTAEFRWRSGPRFRSYFSAGHPALFPHDFRMEHESRNGTEKRTSDHFPSGSRGRDRAHNLHSRCAPSSEHRGYPSKDLIAIGVLEVEHRLMLSRVVLQKQSIGLSI